MAAGFGEGRGRGARTLDLLTLQEDLLLELELLEQLNLRPQTRVIARGRGAARGWEASPARAAPPRVSFGAREAGTGGEGVPCEAAEATALP